MWRPVYSYRVRSSKIIQEIEKQMEEIKEEVNLQCKETVSPSQLTDIRKVRFEELPIAQYRKVPKLKPAPSKKLCKKLAL